MAVSRFVSWFSPAAGNAGRWAACLVGQNKMFIDKNTGRIELPNGLVITPELDKAGFENSAHFVQASPYAHGTLPFQWYRFDGGQIDGHFLYINLCFYSVVLVDFHVSASLYPPGQSTWENWSLESESQTKAFHDHLLQNELGKPHKRVSMPVRQNQPTLDYHLEYNYKWGSVWSGYDSRAGSSSIIVRYGTRLRDAQNDYRVKNA
jgi:hypothetical protein